MPCYGPDHYDITINEGTYLRIVEERDTATRLLCELMHEISDNPSKYTPNVHYSKELREWYEKHLELDKQREREAIQNQIDQVEEQIEEINKTILKTKLRKAELAVHLERLQVKMPK